MALTYRALALLLTYPTTDVQAAAPAIMDAIRTEGMIPTPIVGALEKLARKLEHEDLFDLQADHWVVDVENNLPSVAFNSTGKHLVATAPIIPAYINHRVGVSIRNVTAA